MTREIRYIHDIDNGLIKSFYGELSTDIKSDITFDCDIAFLVGCVELSILPVQSHSVSRFYQTTLVLDHINVKVRYNLY